MNSAVSLTQTYFITLAGKVNDPNFHKCLACIKYLESAYPKHVKT